ncbi:GGDEF domain-containing protein [Alteromonas flava]|uniref:tetratricopeptide repeat-containing diguanylate cyclase n=1 Tax=Alteromonas flava TaxID=2048003 RepID=UPI000C28C0C2|nr:GGDEF domain-containing protein [Alteromonas flava]
MDKNLLSIAFVIHLLFLSIVGLEPVSANENSLTSTTQVPVREWSDPIRYQLNQIDSDPNAVIEHAMLQLRTLDSTTSSGSPSSAEWLYLLSKAFYAQIKADQALWHAEQGLTLTSKAQNPWLYYQLTLAKTNALDLAGKAEEGISLVNEVYAWAEQESDFALLQEAAISDGLINLTLGDYTTALDSFQQAEQLSRYANTYPEPHIASFIALVYEYRGDVQEAMMYFEIAANYYRNESKWLELSNATYGLGRAYKSLGELEKGKTVLYESLELSKQIKDTQGEAYTLKELASIYTELEEYEQARKLIARAINIFSNTYNPYMMLNSYLILTDIEIVAEEYQSALNNVNQALEFVTGESMRPHLIDAQQKKAKILSLLGDFKAAYELTIETETLATEYRKQQSEGEFLRIRAEFELDKQTAQNALLSAENERQQALLVAKNQRELLWLISTLFVVVICIVLLVLYFNDKRTKARLEKLAHHDSLTGLYSRHFVIESLENLMSVAHRYNEPLSVAMIDIDFFKQLNDEFGHSAGDAVLREFGEYSRMTFRDSDVLGRIGGEEFLFVFPRSNINDTQQRLEAFTQATQAIPENLNIKGWNFTASIGLLEIKNQTSVEEVLRQVDEGLYKAKNNGRDRIVQVEHKI